MSRAASSSEGHSEGTGWAPLLHLCQLQEIICDRRRAERQREAEKEFNEAYYRVVNSQRQVAEFSYGPFF